MISSFPQHERSVSNMSSRSSIRYVLIPKFCELTGYTDKAVRRKIEDGIWLEGLHFRRAPDGHVLMDIESYNTWVEQTKCRRPEADQLKSA